MRPELVKKVERAIKLLQAYDDKEHPVEVAYSGGKDSDVILQLAKEAGINYRAIYKNTTIDPPGTIKHAREMGAEVIMPKKTFFKVVEEYGLPNRFKRFCCKQLKEYKILDKAIMGVRKAESTKRAARYTEPTECRFYGSKKEHVEAIYPILDWTDEDVVDFIVDRNIPIHKLYFKEDGTIDPKRRLGCMCCPLASIPKRKAQFKERPNMVKAYLRAHKKWWDTHPNVKSRKTFTNIYAQFVRDVFYDSQAKFEMATKGMFGEPDYKAFLEEYFKITL